MSAAQPASSSVSKSTSNAGRRPSLSQEALAAYDAQQLRAEQQQKEQQHVQAADGPNLLTVAAGGAAATGAASKPKFRLSQDERRLSATSLRLRSDVEMWLTEQVPKLTGEKIVILVLHSAIFGMSPKYQHLYLPYIRLNRRNRGLQFRNPGC